MIHFQCEVLKAVVSDAACEKARKEKKQYQQTAHCAKCKGWKEMGFKEVDANYLSTVEADCQKAAELKRSHQAKTVAAFNGHPFEVRK